MNKRQNMRMTYNKANPRLINQMSNVVNKLNNENEYDNLFVISSTSCSSYCYSSSGNEHIPKVVNREKELKKKSFLKAQREANIRNNTVLRKKYQDSNDKTGLINNNVNAQLREANNNGSVIIESVVNSSGSASGRRNRNENHLHTNLIGEKNRGPPHCVYNEKANNKPKTRAKKLNYKISNVAFNISDEYLIVADGITNKSNSSKEDTFAVTMKTNLSIFCLKTYEEMKNFDLKKCNSFVSFIKPNPFFTDIILFACFRKYIYLMNVQKKKIVKKYSYDSELKNLSADWSQNGYLFIVSHNYGYFSIFTLNQNACYKLTLSEQITSYQICTFNEPSINDLDDNYDNINSLPDIFLYNSFEINNIDDAVDVVRYNNGTAMTNGLLFAGGMSTSSRVNNRQRGETGGTTALRARTTVGVASRNTGSTEGISGRRRNFNNNWNDPNIGGTISNDLSSTSRALRHRRRNEKHKSKGKRVTRRNNRIIEDSSEYSYSSNSIYTLYTDSNSKTSMKEVEEDLKNNKRKKKHKNINIISDNNNGKNLSDDVRIIDKNSFEGKENKHVINLENIPSNNEVINVEDVHRECIKNNSIRNKEVINLDSVISDNNYPTFFGNKKRARNRLTSNNIDAISSPDTAFVTSARRRHRVKHNEKGNTLSKNSSKHSSASDNSRETNTEGVDAEEESKAQTDAEGNTNGDPYLARKKNFIPMKKKRNFNTSIDFKLRSSNNNNNKHNECLLLGGGSSISEGMNFSFDTNIEKLKEFFSAPKQEEKEHAIKRRDDQYISDLDSDFEKCSSICFFSDNSDYGNYSDDLFYHTPNGRAKSSRLNNPFNQWEMELCRYVESSRDKNTTSRVSTSSKEWEKKGLNPSSYTPHKYSTNGRYANPWYSGHRSEGEDEDEDEWWFAATCDADDDKNSRDDYTSNCRPLTLQRKDKACMERKRSPCLLNFINENILVDKNFKMYEQELQPLLPKFSSFNCYTSCFDKIKISPIDPICVHLGFFNYICQKLKSENKVNLKHLLTYDILYKELINYEKSSSSGNSSSSSMASAYTVYDSLSSLDHREWFDRKGIIESNLNIYIDVKNEHRNEMNDSINCGTKLEEHMNFQVINVNHHKMLKNEGVKGMKKNTYHRKNEKSESFLRMLKNYTHNNYCYRMNKADDSIFEHCTELKGEHKNFIKVVEKYIELFKHKSVNADKYKKCYMNAIRFNRTYKKFMNTTVLIDSINEKIKNNDRRCSWGNRKCINERRTVSRTSPYFENPFHEQMNEMSISLMYKILKKLPCREEEDIDNFIYYNKKMYEERKVKSFLKTYLKHYENVEKNKDEFDHRLFVYTNNNRMLYMNSHTMKLLNVLQENYSKSLVRESFNLMNNCQLKGRNCIIKNIDGINNCTFLNPYALYLRSSGNYEFLNSRNVQNSLLSSYARYNELFNMFRNNLYANNAASTGSVLNTGTTVDVANALNSVNANNVTSFLINYENVISSGRNTEIAVISEHSSVFTSDQSANYFTEDEEEDDDDDDDDDYVHDDYDFTYNNASSSYTRRYSRRNRRNTRAPKRSNSGKRKKNTRNNNNNNRINNNRINNNSNSNNNNNNHNNTPRRTSVRNKKNNDKKNYNYDPTVYANVRKSDRLRNKEINRRENNSTSGIRNYGSGINQGDSGIIQSGSGIYNNGNTGRYPRNPSNHSRNRYNTRSSNVNRDFI